MRKLDKMQKLCIANKILENIIKGEFDAGEEINIKVETTRKGIIKEITIKQEEQS